MAGKFERGNRNLYMHGEVDQLSWIGDGFVFVQYLPEDIFWGDVFILADGTEITLRKIKIQSGTKEPLTTMEHGWKCLCRFENLDLGNVPAVKISSPASRLLLQEEKDCKNFRVFSFDQQRRSISVAVCQEVRVEL